MDDIKTTIEETLKKIKESFPDVNLEQYENDLTQYFSNTNKNFTTTFYIYIRKLFLCEHFKNTYGAIDDDDKQVIDQIIKDDYTQKDNREEKDHGYE